MKLFKSLLFAALVIPMGKGGANVYPEIKNSPHLFISHFENVLGTSLELKIAAFSPDAAAKAESAVLREIGRMSKILSAYDTDSEFSRWLKTNGKPVPVSHELFEVMDLFDQWRYRTNGALDASAEVITRLWKQAAQRQQIPSREELDNAIARVKCIHWILDAKTQTAIHMDNAPLMLNSFVKSYIVKHAAAVALKSGNINAVIVNVGGDMVIAGNIQENVVLSNPKSDAENDTPLDQLLIRDRAVATSGNYRRGEWINGHWYSHIVDPRTGQPADDILSATVVASSATDAGALATAFNVLPASESVKLAAAIPGIEYLILTRNGDRLESPGWNKLHVPVKEKTFRTSTDTGTEKKQPGWDTDFEMIINLEINLQKEGFVKRPYVAVWVEDENHAAIRTIAVWHGSERYLNELRSWHLKYRGLYYADKTFSSSVTSATRPAGKYTLKWDGKDDRGNFVKPGKYVIKIEASREHGTYQLMRQEMVCDGTPKSISIPGNIEIASASLDYRKKTTEN